MSLPHSDEQERTVIVNVLMDGPPALSKALDAKIGEECFYNSTHRKVWKSILWLHLHGKPIDISVLAEELKKNGKLEELGGYSALVEVTTGGGSAMSFPYAIEKVRELHMLRRLITIAEETKEKAIGYSGSVDEFVAKVSAALALKGETEKVKTMDDIVAEVAASCSRILAGHADESDTGMRWPWAAWNNTLGPAQGGELIIVAARPGIGKSSCARQMAWKWAQEYGDVLYFSHEMTQRSVVAALAQSVARVSYRSLKRGELNKQQGEAFMAALNEVAQAKRLHVFDRDCTYAAVMSRIQALKQVRKIKAVFVDYLQIQDPQQDRGETRDLAIGRMSKGYKMLANELDIPVILLSQISRMVERDGRRPYLSDLRESGNIEQDADRVVFLHAPKENPRTGAEQDLNDGTLSTVYVEAIQAKGRGEGQHTAELMFHRPTTTFHDIAL